MLQRVDSRSGRDSPAMSHHPRVGCFRYTEVELDVLTQKEAPTDDYTGDGFPSNMGGLLQISPVVATVPGMCKLPVA